MYETFVIDNQKYELEKIGKGSFTTAYRNIQNPDQVLLFTRTDLDTVDYSKEALCGFTLTEEPNKHIPKLEELKAHYEIKNKEYKVFVSKYYSKLTSSNKEAWKQYKILKTSWESIPQYKRPSYEIIETFMYKVKPLITSELYEALEAIENGFRNFTDFALFEFFPRNLKVDNDGNLILLDVMFDRKVIDKIWGQRVKNRWLR